ncbi:minor histocompatibility antigen H13 [Nematocida minor]|uniref:minor histocompatibility antigen H13 n=1 Tax=Nematocida minor TaxID=1912983 RepID=UPI0022201914|nr:minor histocompatibility antigen H13 [Nematocida minor]KAI5191187.1 minor histocompatibility antigen H13 [Nematocida minor]
MLSGLFLISVSSTLVWFGTRVPQYSTVKKESMSMDDAKMFPVLGSVILVSLFCALRYLPKNMINTLFRAIFSMTGTVSLYKIFKMVHEHFTGPAKTEADKKKKDLESKPKAEKDGKAAKKEEKESKKTEDSSKPENAATSSVFDMASLKSDIIEAYSEVKEAINSQFEELKYLPYGCLFVLSLAVNLWYFKTKSIMSSNILACAFSIMGIQEIRPDSTKTVLVLLGLLFVYDIFWVFCTPVMLGVAKGLDIPIKIVYPFAKKGGSMIGLGDIVIPGLFLALAREFAHKNSSPFVFFGGFVGYVLALIITFAVVIMFKAGQPALLYICPLIVAGSMAGALFHKKTKQFIDYKSE